MTASYTYNGDGQRMSKTVNGKTTQFIWDGMNMVYEYTDGESDGTGSVSAAYVYGPSGILYNRLSSGENYIYTTNAHGDVISIVDKNGAVQREFQYDAWGNPLENAASPGTEQAASAAAFAKAPLRAEEQEAESLALSDETAPVAAESPAPPFADTSEPAAESPAPPSADLSAPAAGASAPPPARAQSADGIDAQAVGIDAQNVTPAAFPPLSAGVVYVSDLEWLSETNGWGPCGAGSGKRRHVGAGQR